MNQTPLKILISNDDGIYAPGILALTKALSSIAKVMVVAPDRNRSGAGHSLTLSSPLRMAPVQIEFMQSEGIPAYAVEGTPTDCVHLGMGGCMTEQPDIVVSGVNDAANLGDDVLYSGTVAAAMEGRFLGSPAIAVSLFSKSEDSYYYFETGARVACQLVQLLQHKKLPAATILNVNVPNLPFEQIRGYEITRLGSRHRSEPIVSMKDPRGRPIYWIGSSGLENDAGLGTDFFTVNQGKVSITPLHADLTHYQAFESLSMLLSGL